MQFSEQSAQGQALYKRRAIFHTQRPPSWTWSTSMLCNKTGTGNRSSSVSSLWSSLNSQPLFDSCPVGRDRGNEPKSVWEFRLPLKLFLFCRVVALLRNGLLAWGWPNRPGQNLFPTGEILFVKKIIYQSFEAKLFTLQQCQRQVFPSWCLTSYV